MEWHHLVQSCFSAELLTTCFF